MQKQTPNFFAFAAGAMLAVPMVATADPRTVPGVVIARFDPEGNIAPREMAMLAAASIGGEVTFVADFVPGLAVFRCEVGTEDESIETIRGLPCAMYAQRDHLAALATDPNDPDFSVEWYFKNTGQTVNGDF